MQRNFTLDIIRTLAIVLMVIFHFIYDLKLFSIVNWDIPDGFGWQQFRWVIISLFFVALGVSLVFAHESKFKLKKFSIRVIQISIGALLISIGSYLFVRENWIFFGVLHFIAFSSIVAIWFVHLPRVSLVVGSVIMVIGATNLIHNRWPFHIFFPNLPNYTNDFVSLFPWLGIVFIGIFLGHSSFLRKDPLKQHALKASHSLTQMLVWPGQHSLSIYLLHQPILIALLYVFTRSF